MKKIEKLFVLLFLFCVCVGTLNVNAACASGVKVGEEFVCLASGSTQGNANGTAYPENGELVLKNYNGGNITYTSGVGRVAPVTIKLIGDNYITANNSYGLGVFRTGVNFIGDGTLTITSKLAIVSLDSAEQSGNVSLGNNVTTVKIVAGNNTNSDVNNNTSDNTVTNRSENDNENEVTTPVEKDFDLTLILVIVSCCVSVLCLLTVFITISNNKKEK